MPVCEMLVMLNSVSGPKPVCLPQLTIHLDLEALKPVRCWCGLQDGEQKRVPGCDGSVGECPEDRVIGVHRQRYVERAGMDWQLLVVASFWDFRCVPTVGEAERGV